MTDLGDESGGRSTAPKIAFVGGAGTVGASAAFRVAELGLASEIVLVDARGNMALSHAMDLEQAIAGLNDTTVHAGSWDDLEGSAVVVLSASLPERNVASRDEYLTGNVAIVREAARHLAERCPEAVVLVATNPIDVFTFVLARLSGLPRERVIGYSWNDTLRLRWAVARALGVSAREVDGLVLGEHGETQVPLLGRVQVGSQPVTLTERQRRQIDEDIRGWFSTYQALQSGRTSGWTSAVGIGEVLTSLVQGSKGAVPCSAILEGEYGLRDVSLGVPVSLGRDGVNEIVELPLEPGEQQRMELAARKVRGMVDRVLAGLRDERAL